MEFYRANRDVSALTNWRWWKIVDSHSWRAVLGKAWAGTPSGSTTKEFLPSPSSRRASHRMLPGQCVAVSMRLSTGQGPDLLDYSNFDQRCSAHMRWPTAAIAGIRDEASGPNSTPLIAKRHKRCATSSRHDSGKRCAAIALGRRQMLALPAFHCSQGMFQSPSPSVPGRIDPTVLAISTTSPRLELL